MPRSSVGASEIKLEGEGHQQLKENFGGFVKESMFALFLKKVKLKNIERTPLK